jgi:hypothetical protein
LHSPESGRHALAGFLATLLFFMLHPVIRYSRFLLGVNVVLAAVLLVAVTGRFLGLGQSRNAGDPISALIAQQAQTAAGLLNSELDRVRQETQAAAELATHIFSNPESYRLAAQPGEYDYDQGSGLYGSVRNDGTSVVFLSAASTLNPEILREIRLSEYLNPVFKTSASLNPLARNIALYTTDGLVRSYPWFDFKNRIDAGALKRSFLVTEFSFFSKAMPSGSQPKGGVCEVVSGGPPNGESQLVCAAPFLAGERFRGVIAIEVDASKLAARLFEKLERGDALGLLLASGDRVLGASRNPESNGKLSGRLPEVLKNLKVSGLAGVAPLLQRTASAETFVARQAGFIVAGAAPAGLPVRLVLVVSEAFAARQYGALRGPTAVPVWWLVAAGLACGLLLVDAWWIAEARRNLSGSERKLSESITALSDLNLRPASIASPQGMLGDLYPKFTEGLHSIQIALDAGPPAPVLEESAAVAERLRFDLNKIEHQAAVFCAFDAADCAEHNLNRLAAVLRTAFEAQLASLLIYSDSALRVLPLSAGALADQAMPEWRDGAWFDALNRSPGVLSSNSLALSPEELQRLSPLIQGSFLAMPLLEDQRLLGAVVISDKPSGFSVEDEALLGALQPVLSKTVRNVCRSEDLSKLNQLRREYCLELANAVETPLHRIRAEVQSIYARLGKLTPYYKQHCETILFEVGKLYEMLQEAREAETAAEAKPSPVASAER